MICVDYYSGSIAITACILILFSSQLVSHCKSNKYQIQQGSCCLEWQNVKTIPTALNSFSVSLAFFSFFSHPSLYPYFYGSRSFSLSAPSSSSNPSRFPFFLSLILSHVLTLSLSFSSSISLSISLLVSIAVIHHGFKKEQFMKNNISRLTLQQYLRLQCCCQPIECEIRQNTGNGR